MRKILYVFILTAFFNACSFLNNIDDNTPIKEIEELKVFNSYIDKINLNIQYLNDLAD